VRQRLEVGEGCGGGGSGCSVDVSTIVSDAEAAAKRGGPMSIGSRGATPRENDPDFVDDDEVPPLM
jgi:hypothetical protein